MLTEKMECENCLTSNCKELKFDLLRKEWCCSTCENKRLKAEKEAKQNEKTKHS